MCICAISRHLEEGRRSCCDEVALDHFGGRDLISDVSHKSSAPESVASCQACLLRVGSYCVQDLLFLGYVLDTLNSLEVHPMYKDIGMYMETNPIPRTRVTWKQIKFLELINFYRMPNKQDQFRRRLAFGSDSPCRASRCTAPPPLALTARPNDAFVAPPVSVFIAPPDDVCLQQVLLCTRTIACKARARCCCCCSCKTMFAFSWPE